MAKPPSVGILLLGGGAAQNLPSNLTVVFGVTEQVTGVSGPGLGQVGSTVQSDIVAGGVNFFEIYANNSGTNNLTGQGFANGDLILSGTLDSLTNPLAVTNNNANAGDLDQFNGDSYSGFDTVGTSGNTGILVNNLWLNPDYFRLVNGETLTSLLLSTQFQAPFNGVDPSARFLIGGVETLAGAGLGAGNFSNLGLGNINGGQPGQGGPSVQVQGDANIGFQLEEAPPPPGVPEPATIAVFGLMAGMGGLVHRRRNAKVVA